MNEAILLVMAGLTASLTEALKRFGLDSKFARVAAIVVGEAMVFGFVYNASLTQNILMGLGVGLAATGGYENLKGLWGAFTKKT